MELLGHARRGHGPIGATHGGTPAAVGAYERFLELPVWVVLAAMWAAGVALLGSCALALYVLASLLLQIVT